MPAETTFRFMVTSSFRVELLEARHAVRVLLILRTTGPMIRSALYDEVSKGMGTAMARVNELLDAGLLEEHIMDKRPYAKTISLSSKGNAVAEHLAKVEEILAGVDI